MREVERAIRPRIQVDFHRFRDIDLVSSVVTELKNNKLVLASWQNLIGYAISDQCEGNSNTTEKLSEGLFEEVVKRWTATRGRHILKSIIFQQKMSKNSSIARMGEASMRRTLDKQ